MPEIMFITTVVVLLGGILYWVCFKLFKKTVDASNEANQEESILNSIIEIVHQQASSSGKSVNDSEVSKVLLLERLNISPKYLKRCIQKLSSKEILTEGQDHVKITPFGVAFFKMFGRDAKWHL